MHLPNLNLERALHLAYNVKQKCRTYPAAITCLFEQAPTQAPIQEPRFDRTAAASAGLPVQVSFSTLGSWSQGHSDGSHQVVGSKRIEGWRRAEFCRGRQRPGTHNHSPRMLAGLQRN